MQWLKLWIKRLWCQHIRVEIRTYLENVDGPCVRRTVICSKCGLGRIAVPLPYERTLALLAQAAKLPKGEIIEI
jgi:hypothetical protein